MPRIDDRSAEGGAGRSLKSAWVTLRAPEAQELLDALNTWAEELEADELDPQCYSHISDADGNALTIAVEPGEA